MGCVRYMRHYLLNRSPESQIGPLMSLKKQRNYSVFEPVKRNRSRQRERGQQWIAKLAKSKRNEYIAQYCQRVEEVETIQQTLWGIINNPQTGQGVKVKAVGRLLDCVGQLIALYDAMPIVAAIRDYGCGYDHDKDKPRPLIGQQNNHQD